MNEFSQLLGQSARRLRDRRNAALRVPPCPLPAWRSRLAWAGTVAAACVGLVAGVLMPRPTSEQPASRTARVDTVVRFLPAPGPIATDISETVPTKSPSVSTTRTGQPSNGVTVEPPRPVEAPPSESDVVMPYVPEPHSAGSNVCSDGVDYSLLVQS